MSNSSVRILLILNDIFAGSCGSEDFYAGLAEVPGVLVYPNPVREVLHVIDVAINTPYQILDVQGRLWDEGIIENQIIPMQQIPAGLYLLKVNESIIRWIKE